LNADSPWQEIPDGRPGSIGSVENHRIALPELRLHGIAASIRPSGALPNGTTKFPKIDEDIYLTALRGSTQLGAIHVGSDRSKPSAASDPPRA
jgi:hypothetical protein